MSADASVPTTGLPAALRPVTGKLASDTLPRPLSTFVGREAELAALRKLLADGARLITITGTGGSGKTRLAIALARVAAAEFPDGVGFAPLAATRDPALVRVAVADAFHLPRTSGQRVEDRLHAFLQGKTALLALDNLEHLLDAGPFVADLLAHHATLTVLATSQVPLGLTGEHVFALAPLSPDDARSLFVQRAHAHAAQIDTSEDGDLVDLICARLDHLPLAIELAAARMTVLDLAALNGRLEDRLPVLAGGPRDAPERQRTMRDTIAWSHDLLNAREQSAFRRLAVFVGGFTLNAAGAVALDGGDALDLLESLVARSLVVRTQPAFGAPRFVMYETIRDFAWERLEEADEAAATRLRHADWLITQTEEAIPYYDGPDLARYRNAINAEFDNIRSALGWLLEMRDAERAVRLSGAIWRNWWAGIEPGSTAWNERLAEGLAWIERALALDHDLPIRHATEALMGAILHCARLGRREQARAHAERLLEQSQAEGYPYGEHWAWHGLARLDKNEGKLAEAEANARRALELAPLVRDSDNQAALALLTLGEIALDRDDTLAAEAWLQDSLARVRKCGNPHVCADVALWLGTALRRLGRFAEAAASLTESLEQLSSLGDWGRASFPLVELAQVAAGQGQPDKAVQILANVRTEHGNELLTAPVAPIRVNLEQSLPALRFAAAWEAGQRLTWDEVLVLARSLATGERSASVADPESRPHGMTRREVDVLRLLAAGQSNRAVAATLSISERTVENHVFHLCSKLGLDSRTAAVAWAVRNGIG